MYIVFRHTYRSSDETAKVMMRYVRHIGGQNNNDEVMYASAAPCALPTYCQKGRAALMRLSPIYANKCTQAQQRCDDEALVRQVGIY